MISPAHKTDRAESGVRPLYEVVDGSSMTSGAEVDHVSQGDTEARAGRQSLPHEFSSTLE